MGDGLRSVNGARCNKSCKLFSALALGMYTKHCDWFDLLRYVRRRHDLPLATWIRYTLAPNSALKPENGKPRAATLTNLGGYHLTQDQPPAGHKTKEKNQNTYIDHGSNRHPSQHIVPESPQQSKADDHRDEFKTPPLVNWNQT